MVSLQEMKLQREVILPKLSNAKFLVFVFLFLIIQRGISSYSYFILCSMHIYTMIHRGCSLAATKLQRLYGVEQLVFEDLFLL